MKKKDLMFYAVLTLSVCAFVLPVLAAQYSLSDNFPGFTLFMDWIKAGDAFALSKG
jgi:hypothetical protein